MPRCHLITWPPRDRFRPNFDTANKNFLESRELFILSACPDHRRQVQRMIWFSLLDDLGSPKIRCRTSLSVICYFQVLLLVDLELAQPLTVAVFIWFSSCHRSCLLTFFFFSLLRSKPIYWFVNEFIYLFIYFLRNYAWHYSPKIYKTDWQFFKSTIFARVPHGIAFAVLITAGIKGYEYWKRNGLTSMSHQTNDSHWACT